MYDDVSSHEQLGGAAPSRNSPRLALLISTGLPEKKRGVLHATSSELCLHTFYPAYLPLQHRNSTQTGKVRVHVRGQSYL